MLDSLRNAIDTWYAKVLLGILVLCFALLWGIPQLTDTQGSGIIESGSTKLSLNDAVMSEGDTLYRAAIIRGAAGRGLFSKEEFIVEQSSIYAQQPLHYFFPVAMRLLNEVVLEETAREFKIGASTEAIRREISNDPFFKGQNNTFDPQAFQYFENTLKANYGGYIGSDTILGYFVYYAKRDQILSAMSGNAKIPNVFYDAFNQYQNEKRQINYITLTPAMIGELSISDADLATWFENNKNHYLSPAYREVSYLTLTPQKAATPEEMKKIHDEIDILWFNGSDLAEIAQNYGLSVQTVVFDANGQTMDGSPIQGLPQNQLVSSAFSADVGFHENPLIIPQNGGYVWYQVNKIIEPRSKELSEVHAQALNDWKALETQNRLTEKANQIAQDIVLKGKTFAQIADETGLEKHTQADLQRGTANSSFSPQAMQAFFNGQQGSTAVTNGLTPNDYVVFEISNVTRPASNEASSLPDNLKAVINMALEYDINNAFIQGRMEKQGGVKMINQQLFQQFVQGNNNG